jgi:hypothetical protein
MTGEFIGFVAILGVFTFLTVFVYMFFRTRHNERMAMIESGQDSSLFREGYNRMSALKYGLLFVFLGLGAGIGSAITIITGAEHPGYIIPSLLIFGGLGLLVYYKAAEKNDLD